METKRTSLVLKRFKDLGLSAYEAKGYLSLLQRDTLTVPEVARLAGIPRTNAYDALEKLMVKGMCISRPGRVKKYSASDPSVLQEELLRKATAVAEAELAEVSEKEKQILGKHRSAVERLKRREREILERHEAAKDSELGKLNEKKRQIREKADSVKENMAKMVAELKPQYDTSRQELNPMDYIEVIKDPYQVHKRIMQLHAQAKEQILVFTKPPFTGSREILEEQIDQQTEVRKRGLQIKCIYEIASDEDERKWQFEVISRAVSMGEEARVLHSLPMKMAIYDERIVLYALEDPVSGAVSLTSQVVSHRSLAHSLKILFDTLWQQAEDYHVLEG